MGGGLNSGTDQERIIEFVVLLCVSGGVEK